MIEFVGFIEFVGLIGFIEFIGFVELWKGVLAWVGGRGWWISLSGQGVWVEKPKANLCMTTLCLSLPL